MMFSLTLSLNILLSSQSQNFSSTNDMLLDYFASMSIAIKEFETLLEPVNEILKSFKDIEEQILVSAKSIIDTFFENAATTTKYENDSLKKLFELLNNHMTTKFRQIKEIEDFLYKYGEFNTKWERVNETSEILRQSEIYSETVCFPILGTGRLTLTEISPIHQNIRLLSSIDSKSLEMYQSEYLPKYVSKKCIEYIRKHLNDMQESCKYFFSDYTFFKKRYCWQFLNLGKYCMPLDFGSFKSYEHRTLLGPDALFSNLNRLVSNENDQKKLQRLKQENTKMTTLLLYCGLEFLKLHMDRNKNISLYIKKLQLITTSQDPDYASLDYIKLQTAIDDFRKCFNVFLTEVSLIQKKVNCIHVDSGSLIPLARTKSSLKMYYQALQKYNSMLDFEKYEDLTENPPFSFKDRVVERLETCISHFDGIFHFEIISHFIEQLQTDKQNDHLQLHGKSWDAANSFIETFYDKVSAVKNFLGCMMQIFSPHQEVRLYPEIFYNCDFSTIGIMNNLVEDFEFVMVVCAKFDDLRSDPLVNSEFKMIMEKIVNHFTHFFEFFIEYWEFNCESINKLPDTGEQSKVEHESQPKKMRLDINSESTNDNLQYAKNVLEKMKLQFDDDIGNTTTFCRFEQLINRLCDIDTKNYFFVTRFLEKLFVELSQEISSPSSNEAALQAFQTALPFLKENCRSETFEYADETIFSLFSQQLFCFLNIKSNVNNDSDLANRTQVSCPETKNVQATNSNNKNRTAVSSKQDEPTQTLPRPTKPISCVQTVNPGTYFDLIPFLEWFRLYKEKSLVI